MGRARERYQARHAEARVLHGVVREHLDRDLAARAPATPAPSGGGRLARGLSPRDI